jgi:hypothetical protein
MPAVIELDRFAKPNPDPSKVRIAELMPSRDELPERFKSGAAPTLATQLFFEGLDDTTIKALIYRSRQGINTQQAFRHIMKVLSSLEPTLAHKLGAADYLFEKWFRLDGLTPPEAWLQRA